MSPRSESSIEALPFSGWPLDTALNEWLEDVQPPSFEEATRDEGCERHRTETEEDESLGQLVFWLDSLKVAAVEPSTGIEAIHEKGDHLPKPESSQSRRRRKKTEYQREYNQISQRERRQEKRRAKRAQKGDAKDDDDTSDFPMLLMIYLAHERDGSLRKGLPISMVYSVSGTDTERVVREYMQRHEEGDGIEFSDIQEVVEYVAIKRSEVISLRRRLNVLGKTERHYDKHLRAIDAKMDLLRKGSAERSRVLKNDRFSAIHKVAVVRHAAVVLPILLVGAAERLDELTVKLNQGREVKTKWLKVNNLRHKLDEEKETAQRLAKWASTVLPMSGTYSEIVKSFKKAEAKAVELEDEYITAMKELEEKVIALEGD